MSACRHGYRECATCLDEARALLADALAFIEDGKPDVVGACACSEENYEARRAALVERLRKAVGR